MVALVMTDPSLNVERQAPYQSISAEYGPFATIPNERLQNTSYAHI
jgi:hypothetical protein